MDEDLDAFLADFGVTAQVGTDSALVFFDQPDQTVLGGMQISREFSMRCKSSSFPTLAHGNTVTIGGIAYLVKEITQIHDGAFKIVSLKRA